MNKKNKTVNFFLPVNVAGSNARTILEYSNRLVKKGFEVIISYPVFDRWDYASWMAQKCVRDTNNRYLNTIRYQIRLFRLLGGFHLFRMTKRLIKYFLNKYEWEGKKHGEIDKRVKFKSCLLYPTNRNMPDADYILPMNGGYSNPHLLYLGSEKGKVIASIRGDYVPLLQQPEDREWQAFVLDIDRRLDVRRYTIGTRTRKNAEELGVRVDAVIHPGVNTKQFSDSGRRGEIIPLKLTLFCSSWAIKGMDFGCAVIKRLREECLGDNVKYSWVGRIKPEYEKLFDVHWGYLYGDDFPKALQETDIFIYPSLYDGFGAPPLQAMASGCALATTIVPGPEDCGIHEENCMMAMPNDVETMVNNVKRLIRETELRDKIRNNGVLTAKKWSWEASTDKLIRFLIESDETQKSNKPVLLPQNQKNMEIRK